MHTLLCEMNKLAFALEPLFYRLVFLSLTALLAGGVVLLVRKLFDKKIPPVWKYTLWGVVLLCLILPWRPHSSLSLAGKLEPVKQISYREEYDKVSYEEFLTHQQMDESAEQQAEMKQLVRREQDAYLKSLFVDVMLPLSWLLGLAVSLALLITNHAFFIGQLRRETQKTDPFPELQQECCKALGIRRRIPVLIQSTVTTPALTGIFRPRILLPAYAERMERGSMRYVLLHELGHYKRKDLWINELLLILQCVYWFNPLLWILFRAMREDMELVNDGYILKKIHETDSRAYARSLVEVLGHAQKMPLMPRLVTMTDGAKNVERRIKMMKAKAFFKKYRLPIAGCCIGLIVVLAMLFLTTGGLSKQKAAQQLMDSIRCEDGVIHFTIPKDYDKTEDWNIHVSGRQEFPDGMSMSSHLFEEENANHSWQKGKEYTIDTNDQYYTDLSLELFLPGDEKWPGEVQDSVDLLALMGGNLQQAAQQLLSSVHCEDGVIRFTIPNNYDKTEDWNIYVSGRKEFPDGMSMSDHLFEEENANHSWQKGKEYTIDTNGQNYTDLSMDLLPPEGEAWPDGMQSSIDLMTLLESAGQQTESEAAVLVLNDFYRQSYTGEKPDPAAAELCTPELTEFLKQQVAVKQKGVRSRGGYVKNLELSFEEKGKEIKGESTVLTVGVKAKYQYPDREEETSWKCEVEMVMEQVDGKQLFTSWEITNPAAPAEIVGEN